MIGSRLAVRAPRLWTLWAASRPSQLALILLLYLLGIGMSTAGSPVVAGGASASTWAGLRSPEPLRQALVGAAALLLVATAVHYGNEYADVDTDALTERTPFSGGSGALVDTGLPASILGRATAGVSIVALVTVAVGTLTGVISPLAAALLVAMLTFGLAYSLPPVALIRRGVGEPVNMILGGLCVPVYGVAVVATPTVTAALAVVPFTLVVGCNLLAVHWPDRRADATVGKRTLAVRWSRPRLRAAYVVCAVASALSVILLRSAGHIPDLVALAHLPVVPFLIWGWFTLTRRRTPLPAVAAMVVLAAATTFAWWWVGLG